VRRFPKNSHAYPDTKTEIRFLVEGFLLDCKVKGKSLQRLNIIPRNSINFYSLEMTKRYCLSSGFEDAYHAHVKASPIVHAVVVISTMKYEKGIPKGVKPLWRGFGGVPHLPAIPPKIGGRGAERTILGLRLSYSRRERFFIHRRWIQNDIFGAIDNLNKWLRV